MKTLLEFLNTRIDDPKYIESKDSDPTTWDVGDILCGYCYNWNTGEVTGGRYHYDVTLPCFYKITKRINNQFTLQKLEEELVSGHHNGQYQVIASDKIDTNEKEVKARINKHGKLQIGSGSESITLRLWDGKTPLHGDDSNPN